MAIYLVSGTAGTGKSQVCRALKERGFVAYDTDDDGLARWQHNQTRYIHPKSTVNKEMRTAQFLDNHSWNVPREYIEELALNAGSGIIFVCGSLGNEEELRNMFTAVFALWVDEETLIHRLITRTTNDWGKQPHELSITVQHHKTAYNNHQKHGDIIINANQPIDKVVDDILVKIN